MSLENPEMSARLFDNIIFFRSKSIVANAIAAAISLERLCAYGFGALALAVDLSGTICFILLEQFLLFYWNNFFCFTGTVIFCFTGTVIYFLLN